jgi:hypothetical protein
MTPRKGSTNWFGCSPSTAIARRIPSRWPSRPPALFWSPVCGRRAAPSTPSIRWPPPGTAQGPHPSGGQPAGRSPCRCRRGRPETLAVPRDGQVSLVVGDTFVYRDESHVTESYAEALTPVLRQELRGCSAGSPGAACSACLVLAFLGTAAQEKASLYARALRHDDGFRKAPFTHESRLWHRRRIPVERWQD